MRKENTRYKNNMAQAIRYSRSNKKKTKGLYCTNCGKSNHEFRDCDVPTTSWGIILVNVNSEIVLDHDDTRGLNIPPGPNINVYSSLGDHAPYESHAHIDNTDIDRYLTSTIYDSITFLMISRKHSLGYVEFVRGRYKVERPTQVSYLFKLMTPSEIEKIGKSREMEDGFSYLWTDLWGEKANHSQLEMNRQEAASKYRILNNIGVDGPEIGLEYLVNEVKARYEIDEWGFPKGRRHRNESERDCAIREFMEESGYTASDFKIIDRIEPIIEEFNGTNGVRYRHVYYVAELVSHKEPMKDQTEYQIDEVGDITFMNINTATQTIRPYHKEKVNLLNALTAYYFDKLILAARQIISSHRASADE